MLNIFLHVITHVFISCFLQQEKRAEEMAKKSIEDKKKQAAEERAKKERLQRENLKKSVNQLSL